jgi:hypothetical protein
VPATPAPGWAERLLARGSGYVYGNSQGLVWRTPEQGGEVEDVVDLSCQPDTAYEPFVCMFRQGIALAGDVVVFGSPTGLHRAPVSGGEATWLADSFAASDIAVHAGQVYWVDWLEGVYRVPLDGGPADELDTWSSGKGSSLAVEGDFLYWGGQSIWKTDLASAQTVKLLGPLSGSLGKLAVDGNELFACYEGGLHVLPTSGGELRQLGEGPRASSPYWELPPRIDGQMVYFGGWKSITRVPRSGGETEELVVSRWVVEDLLVGEAEILWSTGLDVKAIPK